MPYNSRNPDSGSGTAAHQYPIARGFALVILVALGLLFLLRHLFGSIRVEAGTR